MGSELVNAKVMVEAVTAYLAQHFDQVEVKSTAPFNRDGTGLTLQIEADGGQYRLNVLDEAVASFDLDAIVELLADNRVVSVMRDLVGFPVTLTASGCIFGDL